MPFLEVNGGQIHYWFDPPGERAEDRPVLVFSNSLGTNLALWDRQAEVFGQCFRVLRYDTRGHGKSAVTPGPYSNEQLARDVLGLLDGLGIERAHVCGLSMGGTAGMWLGIHAPERLGRLVLSSTAAKIGTADSWKARIGAVTEGGMAAIVEGVLKRWFTAAFIAGNSAVVESTRQTMLACSPEGYIACCESIRDTDLREAISAIRTSTLVISARNDPATPPADGRFLADAIPGAKFVELEGSHLCNVESAAAFNEVLMGFLTSSEAD